MPADTKARYYSWYMTLDEDERIVKFEWYPDGEFISSMTNGRMDLLSRDNDTRTWILLKEVGMLPWVVAQNIARREGFNIEVAEV